MFKKIFDLREKVVDIFRDYSPLVPEAKYKTITWK